MATERDYRKEYLKYHASLAAKKDRASRNKVRRQLAAQGRVSKGDGKDIDHKNGNPRDNSPSNLQVVSKSTNRSKKA